MKTKIGCCGFPIARKKYYEIFKVVEIQQTFYKLIDEKLLKKWRNEAPRNFEFTIKAFQGLTHTSKSPTWKKSNFNKEELKKIEKYIGNLKVNKITLEFWDKMLNYAKILDSKIIVLQLPSSFTDNKQNIKQTIEFLNNVESKKVKIALELRNWKDENKKKIFEFFDVIDIVDIKVTKPSILRDILYTRLHGKYENNKIIYNYEYNIDELKMIKNEIKGFNVREAYILFNNSYMFKNALELLNVMNIYVQ